MEFFSRHKSDAFWALLKISYTHEVEKSQDWLFLWMRDAWEKQRVNARKYHGRHHIMWYTMVIYTQTVM